MRHTLRIAGFACASLVLGSLAAQTVPTQISAARNTELERLSHPQVVRFPAQDRQVSGPDSYPVTHSPQWLAVAQQAQREREAKWALPQTQSVGYDQPPPERDLAVQAAGSVDVEVHRGSDQAASPDDDQPAAAELPEG